MLSLLSLSKVSAQLSEQQSQLFQLFFNEALKYRLNGNYQKALDMYLNCYKLDDKSSAVAFEIARIFKAAGDYKNADDFINIALENDLTNNTFYIETAIDIKISSLKYAECVPLFDKLLSTEKNSDNVDIQNHLVAAKVASEARMYTKAISYLNSIPDKEQYSDYIIPIEYDVYIKQGEKKKAYKYLNRYYKQSPKNPKYNYYLADYYFRIAEPFKGLDFLKKASECPNGDIYLFDLASIYIQQKKVNDFYSTSMRAFTSKTISPEVKYNKLLASLSNKQMFPVNDEGRSFYTAVFDTLIYQHPEQDEFYSLYADYASSCNDISKALTLYDKLYKMGALNADTWRDYLLKLSTIGQQDKVLAYSAEAIEKFPNEPVILLLNGECHLMNKDYNEAIKPLRHSYEILQTVNNSQFNSIKVAVMNDLATSYFYLDSASFAFAYFEEVLKIEPYNVGALNNYSYYLTLSHKDLDKAETMSRKTLDLEPNNSTYLDTYAWVLYNKGVYLEAKFIIEQAISNLGREDADEIYDHYGDILFKCGYIDQAVENWQKAFDISKSDIIKRKIDAKSIVE